MNKTSVYLGEEDLARLRRLQEATGKSQAELIRAGLRVLAGDDTTPPKPASIGSGTWEYDGQRRWDADELARHRGLS